jgi:DNA-3-methyladenine glycosylase I
MTRCSWAGDDPLMVRYHDEEWGRPQHDDRALFELLTLEGAQAGLSWSIVLRKRESYRKAFRGFDPARVARFGASDVRRLLKDAGIVRNRAKIRAAIDNARAFREVQRTHGSFNAFIWELAGGKPRRNLPRGRGDVPTRTEVSDQMSKALRALGFRFVGSTICYAFMQAVGMVDDHVRTCFRAKRRRA